jgi:hypothetical protein
MAITNVQLADPKAIIKLSTILGKKFEKKHFENYLS